jgi:hypothetical protein
MQPHIRRVLSRLEITEGPFDNEVGLLGNNNRSYFGVAVMLARELSGPTNGVAVDEVFFQGWIVRVRHVDSVVGVVFVEVHGGIGREATSIGDHAAAGTGNRFIFQVEVVVYRKGKSPGWTIQLESIVLFTVDAHILVQRPFVVLDTLRFTAGRPTEPVPGFAAYGH